MRECDLATIIASTEPWDIINVLTPEAALAFANKERETWREVVRISGAKSE